MHTEVNLRMWDRPIRLSPGLQQFLLSPSDNSVLQPADFSAIFHRSLFGRAATGSNLFQKYTSFSANANKRFGDHDIKFGWQFLRTKVDGFDSHTLTNQLLATIDDFSTFGAINTGIPYFTSKQQAVRQKPAKKFI